MPNFPTSFDSDSSLFLAVNNLQTSLASGIDNSTLTIPVLSTVGFPSTGFVSIPVGDDVSKTEAIKYTSKNSTTFFASQRGADGTPANSHDAGATCGLFVVAAHHNELKDAVIALEYYVGVSGGGENFLRVNDNGNVSITGTLTGTSATFSSNVTGVTPTSASHLATKAYVDGAQKALIGGGITTITSGTNTITIRSVPNAIVPGSNITITSGTNTTTITAAQPPALIGGTDITITSGTNTITIASTAAASANKPIVGDSFISVVTGTNTINLSADAIVAGNSQITITSGTNTVSVFGAVPKAIVAGSNVQVSSGTSTITITASQPSALIGGTDITITSGTNTITISSTAAASSNKPIIGDSFISVVSGTDTINLSADSIVAGNSQISIISGTNTVSIFGAVPKAIVGGTDIAVTSGTSTITVSSTATPIAGKALVGDSFISVVTGTDTINLYADAITSDSFASVTSGTSEVRFSHKALVAGTDITITSGTSTVTIASTASNKAIVGDNFISVSSGTSTINLSTKAITSDSFASVTSGTNQVRLSHKAILGDSFISVVSGTSTVNLVADAIVGGSNITVSSGTNAVSLNLSPTVSGLTSLEAITVTGTDAQFGGLISARSGDFSTNLTVSGIPVQLQAVTSGAGGIVTSVQGLAGDLILTGADGNNVTTAGINTIVITGFRPEMLTVSGNLQSQITTNTNTINNTIIPNLPTKGTSSFLTNVVDRAGGELRINQTFNNRSLIRKLKVTPTVTGVNSYVLQFFTKNTFSFDDRLEYEATSQGLYVDNELWFHEDEDLTNQLHLSITNTSNFDSTFTVELRFERFS